MTKHVGMGPDGHVTEVHDPGSTGHPIDHLFAILAVDKDGGEGIVGMKMDIGWIPMVTSDPALIERFAEYAKDMAETAQSRAVLVKFTTREEVRVIHDPQEQS